MAFLVQGGAFLVQGGAPPDSSVTTAKIVDDAVTLAKLAAGTDGELITWDTSGNPAAVAVGTATHVLTSNGAGAAPTFQAAAGLTLGTPVATTSGTTINVTSIPSGTKFISITFNAVSLNGNNSPRIRIGDSGGIETSSYVSLAQKLIASSNAGASSTAGFDVLPNDDWGAAETFNGVFNLVKESGSSNTWTGWGIVNRATAQTYMWYGIKALSAELDRFQLTTNDGSDTFDAGELGYVYG